MRIEIKTRIKTAQGDEYEQIVTIQSDDKPSPPRTSLLSYLPTIASIAHLVCWIADKL